MEAEEGKNYVIVTNDMALACSDVCLTNIRKLNNRGETFLTEAGLYEIILQSRKSEANGLKRWIFRLPIKAFYLEYAIR